MCIAGDMVDGDGGVQPAALYQTSAIVRDGGIVSSTKAIRPDGSEEAGYEQNLR